MLPSLSPLIFICSSLSTSFRGIGTLLPICIFFFFKQKTAYVLRISHWSSDVCSSDLPPCSARFHLARLVGERASAPLLDDLVATGSFASDATRLRCRRALAGYFAGALLLPYDAFLDAARATRYDIELLQQRFDAS